MTDDTQAAPPVNEARSPRALFVDHLASLDEAELTALLEQRQDALLEPTPRDVGELADRLNGLGSLASALHRANANEIMVGQSIAALEDVATEARLSDLLGAQKDLVHEAVSGLLRRGLAWRCGHRLGLPARLAEHWIGSIGGGPALRSLAPTILAEHLRAAAAGLDVEQGSRHKGEVVKRLEGAYADRDRVASIANRLSPSARRLLDDAVRGDAAGLPTFAAPRGSIGPLAELERSGLVVRRRYEALIVPREVAVTLWLDRAGTMTDPPRLPDAPVAESQRTTIAARAAQAAVRAVTRLVDDAASRPVAALKKGGVGKRERKRLATALDVTSQDLPLWIDLAYAAGLLVDIGSTYGPSGEYPLWREADPGRRWAGLACAWFTCDHAPTDRDIGDGDEQPPPLPLGSSAGLLRRALLRAAHPTASIHAAAKVIDWYSPLHPYTPKARDDKLAAASHEGELLGVLAEDGLTDLGRALVDATWPPDPRHQCERLGDIVADLLSASPWRVVLQSDLTAVAEGQPPAPVTRLLGEAATPEARSTTDTWRFSPASIRAAMDQGWTADELLEGLDAMSAHEVPQPLAYLVRDVARRYGHIRIRASAAVLVTDQATAAEIMRTPLTGRHQLTQIAPTVLTSSEAVDEVLKALRGAGFAPIAEGPSGDPAIRQLPDAPPAPPAPPQRHGGSRESTRRPAPEVASQLLSARPDEPSSLDETCMRLAGLSSGLSVAELRQLGYALDNRSAVCITYRSSQGSFSTRIITPNRLYGGWLDSWCHLQRGQRDFTVAGIRAVEPA